MTSNVNNNNDGVDEDGFVVIKMRKQKINNKCGVVTSNSNCILNANNCENGNVNVKKEEDHCIMGIIEELVERLINDVISKNKFNE